MYINRPCVVIGRNQNPWLEVNLGLLRQKRHGRHVEPQHPALGDVDLVRRRSGGGTVFHDEGNVNWSVICDFTQFTRDKHAEMVVRALRRSGIARARVNERHDIVLDQGNIPHYLRSPAKTYIAAKGVESVSSPVGNIGLDDHVFMATVQNEFLKTYGQRQDILQDELGPEALENDEVRKGYEELKSLDWTFLQTPHFVFSNQLISDGTSTTSVRHVHSRPESFINLAKGQFSMNVRAGVVQDCEWNIAPRRGYASKTGNVFQQLHGRRLHEIKDWTSVLEGSDSHVQVRELTGFLEHTLPALRSSAP